MGPRFDDRIYHGKMSIPLHRIGLFNVVTHGRHVLIPFREKECPTESESGLVGHGTCVCPRIVWDRSGSRVRVCASGP